MQFYETIIKLNESDHDFVTSKVESGEFSSVSDVVSSLIGLQRDQLVDSPEVIEMVRERYEQSFCETGRFISKEQLLEEIHERARRDGLIPAS